MRLVPGRSCLIAIALCALAPAALAQKLLTVDEIYKALPGVWSMETADPPGSPRTTHCDKNALRIHFETDAVRGRMYVSELLRPLKPGETEADRIARSPVGVGKPASGVLSYAIMIQYDGEKRLDEQGKPVVWYLVMPDKDTFLWHRAGWPTDSFTAPSRRCPDPEAVG